MATALRVVPGAKKMINRWDNAEVVQYIARHRSVRGEELAEVIYLTTLLATEPSLGWVTGGSISLKTCSADLSGEEIASLFIGTAMGNNAEPLPGDFWRLDLGYLLKLRGLDQLTEEAFTHDARIRLCTAGKASPPSETLAHAFIEKKCIIHAHARPILVLSCQDDARQKIGDALGDGVCVLGQARPGFNLAKASVDAARSTMNCRAVIWCHDGIITWGNTAREAYESLIELVSRAESYLEARRIFPMVSGAGWENQAAMRRFIRVAPIMRGLLAQSTGNSDLPHARVILRPWIDRNILDYMESEHAKEWATALCTASDFPGYSSVFPLWMDSPDCENPENFRRQFAEHLKDYATADRARGSIHAESSPLEDPRYAPIPHVIYLRGIGAVCAGKNAQAAQLTRDITIQELAVKTAAASLGSFHAIPGHEIADLFINVQTPSQSAAVPGRPLERQVALVTGAAGAIGAAICEELLVQGCNVVVTDLPGENLSSLVGELKKAYSSHVTEIPLDVTDADSVARGFEHAIGVWGGIDLLVINAGLAHVASLEEMNLDAFRRLTRVNIEGTLLLLQQAGQHFRIQRTGGDIVLISTKNVFAPGARFAAYSATKAAAHQLARIASLEFAELGVRVNMVAPDAVFSHGLRKSGLWAEVGPDRMRARGLSEEGLEEYYRDRNLLKARVTAHHVAKAVLFFATRQTPTTGATLPVDGGLPDSTPR